MLKYYATAGAAVIALFAALVWHNQTLSDRLSAANDQIRQVTEISEQNASAAEELRDRIRAAAKDASRARLYALRVEDEKRRLENEIRSIQESRQCLNSDAIRNTLDSLRRIDNDTAD